MVRSRNLGMTLCRFQVATAYLISGVTEFKSVYNKLWSLAQQHGCFKDLGPSEERDVIARSSESEKGERRRITLGSYILVLGARRPVRRLRRRV